ncbi:flagellar hook-associated protein FlgK [Aestuariibacter sp. AA17]|uniref:Flagellar hook-associated protein 1 n=1 Tax=Fluctibacter corallii TaxID=2984329 RepID=A0ABT3A9X4_9ALTE|nr:flagellar hook-associated protein FlgK [Aestuariibacter sp. AA17]MCV2885479.1 flagellar hook-associated protein FlgK [Aestuariibacter sp. AA17]
MIRNTDLYTIAQSGLRASNTLLDTTGHNIANVNTEGYVRERTTFVTQLYGGVGRGTTERVINTFAQNQLRRDITEVGEHEIYSQRTSTVDNLFASEANSISKALSRFYASIQTATDEPTNMAARQLVLGEANSLVGQVGTMSEFLKTKEEELNLELESTINRANSLIESIAKLNDKIRVLEANNSYEEPGALKNERDKAIRDLAEIMSIETRQSGNDDGITMVNLTSGESLVLEDGTFNLFGLNGNPDIQYKNLELRSTGKPTSLRLAEVDVGGKMGGLFRYRSEVLDPARRELGQIALSMAAAMNEQNRLGMDYDQQLGSNIFQLPTVSGLNYAANSSLALTANARVSEDGARDLTSADYQVTIDAVTPGAPPTLDVTVALLNPDGSPVTDTAGTPITQTYTGLTAQAGTFEKVLGGIEIEFPDGAGYAVGDQFLFQPTKDAAADLEVQMTRPEDIALASPFRVDASINNFGDAELVSTTVTNTVVDNTAPFDPDTSAFDGAGGIQGPGVAPGGLVGAPASVVFTSATSYEVRDSANNVIVTVAGATDLNNLLQQAKGAPGYPAAWTALNDYPGYDFSLQGVPKAGDTFNISYNTDGLNDNRNGLELANLQNKDVVLSSNNGTTSRFSFQEKYANIVSDIGEKAAVADISLKAAEAMKDQSKNWFESVSGVSLDEEAANLVRYQQTYAASARVLTTAQTLFDTILGAVR